MKRHLSKAGVVGIIIAFVTISFSFTALAAEKRKFSMSFKNEKIVSEKFLQVTGDYKNVMKQGESLNIITDSTDPNLIGAEQTVYWQYIRAIGYGTNERGITITRSKDGDCFYSKWESTLRVIKRDIVNWESESESRFQFIGGTGKYSEIKGGGACKGKRTPKEDTAKCEGEWEF
jgi:hypothetical protein